jgi:hypothetical protein
VVDYNLANVVTGTELNELRSKVAEFKEVVNQWIAKNYPQFV